MSLLEVGIVDYKTGEPSDIVVKTEKGNYTFFFDEENLIMPLTSFELNHDQMRDLLSDEDHPIRALVGVRNESREKEKVATVLSIIDALKNSGDRGMTTEEVMDGLEINGDSIRSYLLGLEKKGVILRTEEKRTFRSGKAGKVWKAV